MPGSVVYTAELVNAAILIFGVLLPQPHLSRVLQWQLQGIRGVAPGRPTKGGVTWESCSRWTGTGLRAATAELSTRVVRMAGRAPGRWPPCAARIRRLAEDC